jgi:two-component system nitrogen regulation response regulator GlnG
MTGQQKILIGDDDAATRLALSQAFSRLGYQIRATGNTATLLKWVLEGEGDLVITDVTMPDSTVFDLLPRIRQRRPKLPIIVISAQSNVLTAVSAAQIGAFEYIPKPFELDDVKTAVRGALSKPNDSEATKAQARAQRDEGLPLIGRSAPMQNVYRTISRLVGNDLTVLVTGESGSGKELVARALHDLGPRRDGAFVVSNLAAAARDRVETELFGRGEGDLGKLAEADGGTLFLDEIGDMPSEAQTRLIRIIDGLEAPLSSRTGRQPNVRIVAATNRDLNDLVQRGQFREDLFHRLNVARVRVPPLRDRLEDIPDLARAFLLRAHREGLAAKTIDSGALERLKAYTWPGNVRELKNLIRRICGLYVQDLITARIVERELRDQNPTPAAHSPTTLSDLIEQHLVSYFADQSDGEPPAGLYGRILLDVQRPLIRLTLDVTRGNQFRAAEILGLNRNTLRRMIQDLGVEGTRSGRGPRRTRMMRIDSEPSEARSAALDVAARANGTDGAIMTVINMPRPSGSPRYRASDPVGAAAANEVVAPDLAEK